MRILSFQANFEMVIRGSRFLAEAIPVTAQDLAREILKTQRAKYADATHVVHCFVIGPQANIMGCSDDGEPAGTAGRPALEVLKNSGITNIMVTVTRWFGGTKLGTGGLVKAYTEAVQGVLPLCQCVELVPMAKISFEIAYGLYDIIKRQLAEYEFEISSEDFADSVVISGQCPESQVAGLKEYLVNASKNAVRFMENE